MEEHVIHTIQKWKDSGSTLSYYDWVLAQMWQD